MTDTAVVDRLVAHRTIGSVPREQLEWLAAHGKLRTLEPGEVLSSTIEPVNELFVVFAGHLAIRVNQKIVIEFHGGDLTGLLPYSRLVSPPGNVVAETRCEILALERPKILEMIRECHDLTSVMVHAMLDRARFFKSSELLDEKMASLGRLAAGLAHELNNPASAVARSAKALVDELKILEERTKDFCQLNLSDEQRASIVSIMDNRPPAAAGLSPIDAADRQDALADWLDEKSVSNVELEPLAALSFAPSDFEKIDEIVGEENIGTVLSQISATQTVRQLASEISTAASRIHSLVAAVKGFTYMDQNTALQSIEIARGLKDTITVLGSKAKATSVEIELKVADNLPEVDGYGGELNQVWSNLIDNAIDAKPRGRVRVSACVEHDKVVVRVANDGPAIPPEILSRIFDPFFTTKTVGKGSGLGLDISRRIVERHHGVIEVKSDESGTEFSVTLSPSKAHHIH